MDGLPLAVVIATRAEHETRREPLLQIANGPSARTLRPRPLSVAVTTALLAARSGLGEHDELAIACHEATRGNPFLLHALIGDLAEVGSAQAPDPNTVRALRPQAISRSVLLRLGRLGPEARAVAGAVAVLGGAATLARTATLADLPTEAVARAASALAGADLFDESVTLAFAHPLVQAVVLDDMPALERAAAHARAAAALEATGGRPQKVAAQLLETVPAGDVGVVEALTRAAEEALARGAPDAAATFLQRAAREPPAPGRRASVLRLLGRALNRARGAAGLGPLREAIDAEPRAVPRAETTLELARALEVLSRNREAVDVYDSALSALGASEPVLALTLRAGLAVAAVEHLSTLPRAVEILAADAARVEGGGPRSPVIGALVALAASAAGSPEGVTLAAAALADGELFDVEPAQEVVALLNRFFTIVVEVTDAHGGLVNSFEGDAALCVFGAPIEHVDHASAALAAARTLRERLRHDLPEPDAGIGPSAGTVVAGNIDAERRPEYTVIGDPVNEAARLCELAKRQPERTLASDAILAQAATEEAARWHLGDATVLRGRAEAPRLATPTSAA